jgi:hypothetical protein
MIHSLLQDLQSKSLSTTCNTVHTKMGPFVNTSYVKLIRQCTTGQLDPHMSCVRLLLTYCYSGRFSLFMTILSSFFLKIVCC